MADKKATALSSAVKAGAVVIASLLGSVLSFGSVIVLGRILDADAFGQVLILFSSAAVLAPISLMGTELIWLNALKIFDKIPGTLFRKTKLLILAGNATVFLLAFGNFAVLYKFGLWQSLYAAVFCVGFGMTSLGFPLLQQRERFNLLAGWSLLPGMAKMGIAGGCLAGLYLHGSATLFPAVGMVGCVLFVANLLFLRCVEGPSIDRTSTAGDDHFPELRRQAVLFTFSSLLALTYAITVLYTKFFTSAEVFSLFGMAAMIGTFANIAYSAFFRKFLLWRIIGSKDKGPAVVRSLVWKTMLVAGAFSVVISIVTIFFPFELILGTKFAGIEKFIWFFALLIVIRGAISASGVFLVDSTMLRRKIRAQILAFLINISIGVGLGFTIGIYSTLIALTVSELVLAFTYQKIATTR